MNVDVDFKIIFKNERIPVFLNTKIPGFWHENCKILGEYRNW